LNGQIKETNSYSNHIQWNSDMLTPKIMALSLEREWVGMFWNFFCKLWKRQWPKWQDM